MLDQVQKLLGHLVGAFLIPRSEIILHVTLTRTQVGYPANFGWWWHGVSRHTYTSSISNAVLVTVLFHVGSERLRSPGNRRRLVGGSTRRGKLTAFTTRMQVRIPVVDREQVLNGNVLPLQHTLPALIMAHRCLLRWSPDFLAIKTAIHQRLAKATLPALEILDGVGIDLLPVPFESLLREFLEYLGFTLDAVVNVDEGYVGIVLVLIHKGTHVLGALGVGVSEQAGVHHATLFLGPTDYTPVLGRPGVLGLCPHIGKGRLDAPGLALLEQPLVLGGVLFASSVPDCSHLLGGGHQLVIRAVLLLGMTQSRALAGGAIVSDCKITHQIKIVTIYVKTIESVATNLTYCIPDIEPTLCWDTIRPFHNPTASLFTSYLGRNLIRVSRHTNPIVSANETSLRLLATLVQVGSETERPGKKNNVLSKSLKL